MRTPGSRSSRDSISLRGSLRTRVGWPIWVRPWSTTSARTGSISTWSGERMRLDRKSNARRRDPFQAYYTSDDRLVDYMVRLLDVRDGNRCLEPAAGDGCFVRGLIRTHRRISIDVWELHRETAASLRRAFADRKGV